MIRFDPLTEPEYESFLAQSIEEYADDHTRSGRWRPEEALEASRAEYARLLPEGLSTPDHFLRSIVDAGSGEPVGIIWYWLNRGHKRVFLYDIRIDEPYRRRGHAIQAMQLLENKAQELGADAIGLHVFGHNHAARALYEKLGYDISNLIMTKQLTEA
jgi:RimJ/RimL family protein N-acetyltransferase